VILQAPPKGAGRLAKELGRIGQRENIVGGVGWLLGCIEGAAKLNLEVRKVSE